MKINRDNLIDVLGYYMMDNEFNYLSIRASVGVDGTLIMSICEDIEMEDE